MFYILGMIAIAILIFGPSYWVKYTLEKYSQPDDRYPGTGGELARILLDWAQLQAVRVEVTEQGDHYDPIEKVVRLTADKFNGKSLTAITVAAHEVGHAIQDRDFIDECAGVLLVALGRWFARMERRGREDFRVVSCDDFVGREFSLCLGDLDPQRDSCRHRSGGEARHFVSRWNCVRKSCDDQSVGG